MRVSADQVVRRNGEFIDRRTNESGRVVMLSGQSVLLRSGNKVWRVPKTELIAIGSHDQCFDSPVNVFIPPSSWEGDIA